MYGLLGRKLGHSLSPQIHHVFGDYPYELFCREPDELDEFFADESLTAFNVTIPYKVEAFKHCDELSESAKKIGSVNTVVRRADGTLFGDNTDYFGFSKMAERYGADFKGKKVIILGSGGASLTVQHVARDFGAEKVIVVSRSGENNYDNISIHSEAQIIVNTTPVGMFPNNCERLIDLSQFTKVECVLDLIYNPMKTQLLLDADELGIPNGNGLYMLVAQALRSAEQFFDRKFDDSLIDKAYSEIQNNFTNIVFIGMPGCGKSTVGKIIAEKFSKEFIDTDAEIVRISGRKIPQIFAEDGEKVFREIETEAVKETGKKLGCVIATGGGVVLKKINRDALKQNGIIIYLKRELSDLAVDGRPLSAGDNAVEKLYNERKEIYESFADFTVDVSGDAQITAERVIKCISL